MVLCFLYILQRRPAKVPLSLSAQAAVCQIVPPPTQVQKTLTHNLCCSLFISRSEDQKLLHVKRLLFFLSVSVHILIVENKPFYLFYSVFFSNV